MSSSNNVTCKDSTVSRVWCRVSWSASCSVGCILINPIWTFSVEAERLLMTCSISIDAQTDCCVLEKDVHIITFRSNRSSYFSVILPFQSKLGYHYLRHHWQWCGLRPQSCDTTGLRRTKTGFGLGLVGCRLGLGLVVLVLVLRIHRCPLLGAEWQLGYCHSCPKCRSITARVAHCTVLFFWLYNKKKYKWLWTSTIFYAK